MSGEAIRIHINLAGAQQDRDLRSYTSGDEIKGFVTLLPSYDILINKVRVSFEGRVKTFIDKVSPSANTSHQSKHVQVFLKLEKCFPNDDTLEPQNLAAGQQQVYPFTFIVPSQLPSRACEHEVRSDELRSRHLQIPPCIGDCAVAGNGATLLDDFASDMSRISYFINAAVEQRIASGETSSFMNSQRLRIIPVFEELALPSLHERVGPEEYCTHIESWTRKSGLNPHKTGLITVEAIEPKSMQLPDIDAKSSTPRPTFTVVSLRFDPADEKTPPPRLGNIVTKLHISTYYSTMPMADFLAEHHVPFRLQQDLHKRCLQLSDREQRSVKWTRHPLEEDATESSTNFRTYDPVPVPIPSKTPKGRIFYTAELLAPIGCPEGYAFLPTFHSCYISRRYTIELDLTIASDHRLKKPGNLVLKLPLEILNSPSSVALHPPSHPQSALGQNPEHFQESDQPPPYS